MHAGEVLDDGRGFYGEAIDVAIRLLDSPPLKRALKQATAPLALVVSDEIHSGIVSHGHVPGDTYIPLVRIWVANRRYRGWVHIPHAVAPSRRPARQKNEILATLNGLRARANAGDTPAAGQLTELLVERGDLEELRARADAGDKTAAWRLAELLVERGDLDELRARADAGDDDAAWQLAELLVKRGDVDGLRVRADAGDDDAAWRLAELQAQR